MKFTINIKATGSIYKKTNKTNFWETSYQKTLNKTFRKQELVKITVENQALLRRIQDKKATVNFKQFEKKRKENEKILGIISEYPYKFNKENNKTLMENSSRNNFVFSSGSIEV